jgi:hypothetical protein
MLTLSSNFIRAIQRYVIVYAILTIRRANIEATLGLTREKDLQGSTNIVSDVLGNTFQHQEYFPGGEVWFAEKSTVFRTPFQ